VEAEASAIVRRKKYEAPPDLSKTRTRGKEEGERTYKVGKEEWCQEASGHREARSAVLTSVGERGNKNELCLHVRRERKVEGKLTAYGVEPPKGKIQLKRFIAVRSGTQGKRKKKRPHSVKKYWKGRVSDQKEGEKWNQMVRRNTYGDD